MEILWSAVYSDIRAALTQVEIVLHHCTLRVPKNQQKLQI